MPKYPVLLVVLSLLFSGCRKKTELQKSNAFAEKAGWYSLKEGMMEDWDSTYVPDYSKALAMWDSAIAHSPGIERFYDLKAICWTKTENYRGAWTLICRLSVAILPGHFI